MVINRFFIAAVLAVSACVADVCAQKSAAKPLFEYPQVPDRLTKINMRSNFMIEHLWDNCDLDKTTITDTESFRETFTDYISFFVLADVSEIHKSVEKFVNKVAKNKDNLATVLSFVDSEIYNPAAQYCSDDVYAIFAKYLVANKKVDASVKAMLERNVKKNEVSKIGAVFGNMDLKKGGDSSGTLDGIKSEYTVVVLNVAGDVDLSIYKLRLSTDVVTNKLIDGGHVSVVSVYSALSKDNGGDPANWYTATIGNMEDTYDMRFRPVVYLLDVEKKIVYKSPSIGSLLSIMAQIGVSKGV